MRKVLYITILGLTICCKAMAVKIDSLELRSKLFINFGINQSNLSNNDLYNQSITGLEMGAQVLTHWKNQWLTEIGLQYIRRGSARDVNFLNIANDKVGSYTENIYLHYVTLPILIKKHLAVNKNLDITIGAGVYNALLFSAWLNPQYTYLSHEQAKKYNTYDVGFIGSLGVMYKDKIGLQARYEQGLLNLSKTNGAVNNTFALGLYLKVANLGF